MYRAHGYMYIYIPFDHLHNQHSSTSVTHPVKRTGTLNEGLPFYWYHFVKTFPPPQWCNDADNCTLLKFEVSWLTPRRVRWSYQMNITAPFHYLLGTAWLRTKNHDGWKMGVTLAMGVIHSSMWKLVYVSRTAHTRVTPPLPLDEYIFFIRKA